MPDLFGPSLASALGITDRATGIERAEAARLKMIDRAFQAFGQQTNLNVPKMTLLSMMTRAQAFHDGAIEAAKSDNPFATFTLLRSYAENAAMLIWISTKQGELRRLYPDAPVELKFSIGKLVAHAERDSAGFREIYEQLSRFAHPGSSTAFSGFRVTGQKPLAIFSSRPSFKNDDDFMLACVWLIELAEANGALWVKSWGRYLGATSSKESGNSRSTTRNESRKASTHPRKCDRPNGTNHTNTAIIGPPGMNTSHSCSSGSQRDGSGDQK